MTRDKVTEELIARASRWEPQAVYELVRILEPVCRSRVTYVLFSVGDTCRDEVTDVCQQTWMALLEDAGRLARLWQPAKGMSFENYAALKAEHLAYDHIRKKKEVLWREDEPGEWTEPQIDSSRSPDRLVETNDFLVKIFGILQTELSEDGRKIFCLLFVEQRDVREICGLMRMNAEAVYAWRSRLGRRIEEIASTMGDVQ